jgi:hypothetical protein
LTPLQIVQPKTIFQRLTRTHHPVGTRAVALPITRRAEPAQLPAFQLTKRDRSMVQAVYEHRALTSAQIEQLFFSDGTPRTAEAKANTRCQRRLSLLFHAGYLFRDEQPTKLSEGRKPFVYFLDTAGAQLISDVRGAAPWVRAGALD